MTSLPHPFPTTRLGSNGNMPEYCFQRFSIPIPTFDIYNITTHNHLYRTILL